MENLNIYIEATPAQLDYLIELITLDLALSMMTRSKLQTQLLKDRLETRIEANRNFFNYLRAKKNECSEVRQQPDHINSR